MLEEIKYVWCVYTTNSDKSDNNRELVGIYTSPESADIARIGLKMSIAGAKSGYKRDYKTSFEEDIELVNSMNSTLCDQAIYQDSRERLDRAMEKNPILKVAEIKTERIKLNENLIN
jgi:hypothetical protein